MSTNAERPVTVILVTNDGMGTAEVALRHKLIGVYLKLLLENDYLPAAICFYADGVKLVVSGSPVLEVLQQIEAKGVHLVSCVTCLNYYGLNERVVVGIVGGMHDIVELLQRAQKVITL
jgi:sulfur relay (sulfurtransferase) complex TusBCD TusD component (DsrE family)